MTDPSHSSETSPDPIDLEIRISTPRGQQGQRLEFVLSSPSRVADLHQKTIRGKEVHSPQDFQRRLFAQLDNLNRGLDVDGEPLLREDLLVELTSIGRDLYHALIPAELDAIYRDVADRVGTLLLTTDEPWIPWEILHPGGPDDDFWCMKHRMSRWLTGQVTLVPRHRVRRLLGFEAGSRKGLGKAQQEMRLLQELARSTPGLEPSLHPEAGFKTVVELLERERFDLLHFAGHGEHDGKRPGEAKIVLGKRPFRARHLTSTAMERIREQRPLVFFNSCQVGQMDQALTEADGWAQRWVERCRAGAFLAPAWTVRDSSALRFAELFYHALRQGAPLGEALFQARHHLRQESPGDSAWLAYRLYGSPNARVHLGDLGPTGPAPGDAEASSPPPPRSMASPVAPGTTLAEPPLFQAFRSHRESLRSPAEPSDTSPRSRTLGVAAAVLALALTLSAGWWITRPEDTPPPQEVTESSTAPQPSGSATAVPPELGPPATAVPAELGPPPAKNPIPLATLVPGKIAAFALDADGQQPSFQLASAIRSALRELGVPGPVVIPDADPGFLQSLARGSISFEPSEDRTPWGAEHLLIASGALEELPDAGNLHSLSLSLDAELISTRDGDSFSSGQSTHTGRSSALAGALSQAAARCLRPVLEYLNKGEAP